MSGGEDQSFLGTKFPANSFFECFDCRSSLTYFMHATVECRCMNLFVSLFALAVLRRDHGEDEYQTLHCNGL